MATELAPDRAGALYQYGVSLYRLCHPFITGKPKTRGGFRHPPPVRFPRYGQTINSTDYILPDSVEPVKGFLQARLLTAIVNCGLVIAKLLSEVLALIHRIH